MRHGLTSIVLGTMICLSCGAAARADSGPDAASDSSDPADQHVWELTDYLKGTPAKIRDQVNGELERLTAKQKELKRQAASYDAAILAEQAAAVDAARKSQPYRKLAEEKKQAETALKNARDTGTPQEKLDASSNFNRVRLALEKMETDAVTNDAKLPQLLKDKSEDTNDLKHCDEAVKTAEKWRNTLITAVRTGATLHWPLDDHAHGILGIVTPVEEPSGNSIVIDFEAFEPVQTTGQMEGINKVTGINHKVRLHVEGIDTKGMSKGTPVALDRNFVVVGRLHDDLHTYEVRPQKNDSDRLFELLIPLREAPAPK